VPRPEPPWSPGRGAGVRPHGRGDGGGLDIAALEEHVSVVLVAAGDVDKVFEVRGQSTSSSSSPPPPSAAALNLLVH